MISWNIGADIPAMKFEDSWASSENVGRNSVFGKRSDGAGALSTCLQVDGSGSTLPTDVAITR